MPQWSVWKERHAVGDDLDVHPTPLREFGPDAGKPQQVFLGGSRKVDRVEDVAAFGAAVVVRLEHERAAPDDAKTHFLLRVRRPFLVDFTEEVPNPLHGTLS